MTVKEQRREMKNRQHLRTSIVTSRKERVRAGWKKAARLMHERDEDRLLDSPTPTRFDREEWDW
jgi:hypothetical protein